MKTDYSPSVGSMFTQTLSALGGALLGSMCVLIFLAGLQFTVFGEQTEAPETMSGFLYFGITFISALASNVFASMLIIQTGKKGKDGEFLSSISRIFFVTLILLALASPLYLTLHRDGVHEITRFLLPFSIISAALLLEVATYKSNPILASYKAIAAGISVAIVFSFLFPNPIPFEMMPFFCMPIAWTIIPISGYLVEIVYPKLPK
jgi:hypothetical protein